MALQRKVAVAQLKNIGFRRVPAIRLSFLFHGGLPLSVDILSNPTNWKP
jgi:hypothetical protein